MIKTEQTDIVTELEARAAKKKSVGKWLSERKAKKKQKEKKNEANKTNNEQ